MAWLSSLSTISAAAEIETDLEKIKCRSKRNGQRTRNRAIPSALESVWFKAENHRDDKDFFNFTSLNRLLIRWLALYDQKSIGFLGAEKMGCHGHKIQSEEISVLEMFCR